MSDIVKFDSGKDWSFEQIDDVYLLLEKLARDKYGLTYYPNQVEIITSEQMLDAYCITPDHKLLRKDLRWVEANNIFVGDVVLGFDEEGPHRRYRAATVTNKEYDAKEVFKVVLSSGKTFKVTGNHLWLTRRNKGTACVLVWKSTQELQAVNNEKGLQPTYIPKLMDIWEEDTSKEAGWLAGMYDGEGNILKGGLGKLSIAQNLGTTFEKIKYQLARGGFKYSAKFKASTKSCMNIDILGDVTTRLAFLGKIRPERLINRLDFDQLNTLYTSRQQQEYVVSVKSVGIQRIVKITTSTNTFVCDGYPMHNSAVGMPTYYSHWSFGKQFVKESELYKRGHMGLAYEIVINSNPCIAYCMEENTMAMQALVVAHACFGHNSFFKNNVNFKQWTDATTIIDYLVFAKNYIAECEERYGVKAVEAVLDAAHTLRLNGVDRYKRPSSLSKLKLKEREKSRQQYEEKSFNDIWRTLPTSAKKQKTKDEEKFPKEPEENLLYFIEKNAPNLDQWKREILRIVRKVSQYFYPQMMTKIMNEGWATFWHYTLMNDLYDQGNVTDGFMFEFLASHTGVIKQRQFDHMNPYALGFAMFQDIKRIAMEPTEEDRKWFDWAGNGDWLKTLKHAAYEFKDESFIMQYLSPKVMRDFALFYLLDDDNNPTYVVEAIQNDEGYRIVRERLSDQQNVNNQIPYIQVTNVDVWGDRSLQMTHTSTKRHALDKEDTVKTLKAVYDLWGYPVTLLTQDASNPDQVIFRFVYDPKNPDHFFELKS